MTRVVTYIAAPTQEVYDALVDAPHYPTWLLGARQIRRTERSWPRPGSSFEHHVGAGPVDVADRTTVIDHDPGRSLDLLVRARPILEARVRFAVEPQGSGTRVEMTECLVGRFRVFSPAFSPLVWLRNRGSLQRLKHRLEHGHVSGWSRVPRGSGPTPGAPG